MKFIELTQHQFSIVSDLDFKKLNRGDILQFTDFEDYRNSGKVIYDGSKLLHLDSEPDEYGNVPKDIYINDYPVVDYFEDSITHNYHVSLKYNVKELEFIKKLDLEDADISTVYHYKFDKYDIFSVFDLNLEPVDMNNWFNANINNFIENIADSDDMEDPEIKYIQNVIDNNPNTLVYYKYFD